MMQRQVVRYHQSAWVFWGLVLLQMTQAGFSAEPTHPVGTLHIDGSGIEILVLQQDTGRERTLPRPGTEVVLPEGRYRIEHVVLRGGRTCRPRKFPTDDWVAVGPNTPATLHVGAPLQQVVEVKRRGSVMNLTYELMGQGGEHYSVDRAGGQKAPAFAVYRGDHPVASGDFEFG